MREIQYLDKLIDGLARGKEMLAALRLGTFALEVLPGQSNSGQLDDLPLPVVWGAARGRLGRRVGSVQLLQHHDSAARV